MTDISNKQVKINRATFINMLLRYWAWKKSKGREPNIIYTRPNQQGDYVKLARFNDMRIRYEKWEASHGSPPNFVWTIPPASTPTPPAPVTDWVLTGYFQQDYQNTSYTCGPSSAQMVFSALGLSFNESQIASLAGTTTAGTSHQQLYTAMRKLYPSLDIAEYYLSDIGFDGIIGKLKNNCEIILHIRTGPLRTDADGNGVWQNDYGHYIFLEGVNPVTKRVRVFDPTKGNKEFTYTQITNAINAVRNQKSVMVFYKP